MKLTHRLLFTLTAMYFKLALGGAPLDKQLWVNLPQHPLSPAIGKEESFKDRFQEEVWMVDMGQRLKKQLSNSKERATILRAVHQEAIRENLPPSLILAIIEVESNFNRFALSEAGARGLMQIMPFWLEEIGRQKDNLFDISTNIRLGCTILRHYIDKENGNLTRALARYNGSSGQRWYAERVYQALTHWQP